MDMKRSFPLIYRAVSCVVALAFFLLPSLEARPKKADGTVRPGIEVLESRGFSCLKGKRVGLVTNPSGVDRNMRSTVDILFNAPGVSLVALYGPEHGVRGDVYAGGKVTDTVDPATGLPVYSLYGATRKKAVYPADADPVLVPGSFGIAGLNFTPMYSFSRYFRAGVSLDAQYDESANIGDHIVDGLVYPDADNIRFHRPPFREQFSVGLSVRAEVVMPIFSINLGIGRNILCKGPDTDAFYQILALKTHLTRRLFLHVGYQLSRFKDPNNLMLGLGWRFGNK